METASLTHVNTKLWEQVYDPCEDSFLLLDCLEEHLELFKYTKPIICVEVGVGSGVIGASLSKALGPSAIFIGTDINPTACEVAMETGKINCVLPLEIVCSDILNGLSLSNKVDLLLCNPPYVCTSKEELSFANGLSLTWAGGPNGDNLTWKVMKILPHILSPHGLAFFVLLKQNPVEKIQAYLGTEGLFSSVIMQRKCGIEHLLILRVGREGCSVIVNGNKDAAQVERRRRIKQMYMADNWKGVLSEVSTLPLPSDPPYLCWPTLTTYALQQTAQAYREIGVEGVNSIGAGSALFEWLLTKSQDIPVCAFDVDRQWFSFPQSCSPFLPIRFADEGDLPNQNNWAILFVYFNCPKAFQQYLLNYQGPCVSILGPCDGEGRHCYPLPWALKDQDPWEVHSAIPYARGDVLVMYRRR